MHLQLLLESYFSEIHENLNKVYDNKRVHNCHNIILG